MFATTQGTDRGGPRPLAMPASIAVRRRSAASFKKACSSGKPRVTMGPSTATGRQATMRGFVGGWADRFATTVGHAARSWSSSEPAGADGASDPDPAGAGTGSVGVAGVRVAFASLGGGGTGVADDPAGGSSALGAGRSGARSTAGRDGVVLLGDATGGGARSCPWRGRAGWATSPARG